MRASTTAVPIGRRSESQAKVMRGAVMRVVPAEQGQGGARTADRLAEKGAALAPAVPRVRGARVGEGEQVVPTREAPRATQGKSTQAGEIARPSMSWLAIGPTVRLDRAERDAAMARRAPQGRADSGERPAPVVRLDQGERDAAMARRAPPDRAQQRAPDRADRADLEGRPVPGAPLDQAVQQDPCTPTLRQIARMTMPIRVPSCAQPRRPPTAPRVARRIIRKVCASSNSGCPAARALTAIRSAP
jgi:hypothetical protein